MTRVIIRVLKNGEGQEEKEVIQCEKTFKKKGDHESRIMEDSRKARRHILPAGIQKGTQPGNLTLAQDICLTSDLNSVR